jgi:hypothetical protein
VQTYLPPQIFLNIFIEEKFDPKAADAAKDMIFLNIFIEEKFDPKAADAAKDMIFLNIFIEEKFDPKAVRCRGGSLLMRSLIIDAKEDKI